MARSMEFEYPVLLMYVIVKRLWLYLIDIFDSMCCLGVITYFININIIGTDWLVNIGEKNLANCDDSPNSPKIFPSKIFTVRHLHASMPT